MCELALLACRLCVWLPSLAVPDTLLTITDSIYRNGPYCMQEHPLSTVS
jgi:hypothetical protein